MAMIHGTLGEEITRDVIRTLYGLDTSEIKKPSDAPDILFRHRFDVELGFVEPGNGKELYMLTLNIPLGKMQATPDEWDALQRRLAEGLNKANGTFYRPATWDEICDFYNAKGQEQALSALAQMPAADMYQA